MQQVTLNLVTRNSGSAVGAPCTLVRLLTLQLLVEAKRLRETWQPAGTKEKTEGSTVCSTSLVTNLGSIFNYPGEDVQQPYGACSTTLGSIFNYPGEYVQVPCGAFSTTLWSTFNYHDDYA